jgi:hypothetical protein
MMHRTAGCQTWSPPAPYTSASELPDVVNGTGPSNLDRKRDIGSVGSGRWELPGSSSMTRSPSVSDLFKGWKYSSSQLHVQTGAVEHARFISSNVPAAPVERQLRGSLILRFCSAWQCTSLRDELQRERLSRLLSVTASRCERMCLHTYNHLVVASSHGPVPSSVFFLDWPSAQIDRIVRSPRSTVLTEQSRLEAIS